MLRASCLLVLILIANAAPKNPCITEELLDAYQDQAFEVGRALQAGCIVEGDGSLLCKAAHAGYKTGLEYYKKRFEHASH